jgi:class 3 adenylate cyclase/tetratricopeptide (TPR) repeat protein
VWLKDLGLGEYASAFAENNVDAETLPWLTVEDLKEIGVTSVGHRRKLLEAIATIVEAGQEPPQQDVSAPDPRLVGEQRQVTILFADLTGFTGLSGELGAEETHSLLNRYFETVDGIVADFGGHVDKHIGDNVMAVFGAPVAHSDDPERALRAAFDIHQGMIELSGEFGRTLQAHIGIASGRVVASGTGSETHREYTVTGDSVNLASRLQDKARAGETLISSAVYGAVSSLTDCSPMGEIGVKGFEDSVEVWQAIGLHHESAADRRSPFVGRRSEKRQFTGIIEECRATNTGQAILVRGEAGIGKTRLVEEFEAIAERNDFTTHKGLILDFGVGKGQDAIRLLVRSLLGLTSGDDKKKREMAADKAFEAGWLENDRRVFLNDLLDLPQPSELRALYDAMDNATRNSSKQITVQTLIRRLSAKRPILMAVENIHWADTLTLEYLASIASTVADCTAIVAMTSRVEGDPLDHAWRVSLRGSPLTTIDLQPLRETEASELAGEFVEASNAFLQECIARAEGNPLFLEQLLQNAEEGAVTEIPGSIQSLVLARMDRLQPLDKQALQAASVIGQRFTLDILWHLLDDASYDCSAMVENHLVRPEGVGYLFAHALIRDGVYSSLLRAQRRELHQRAASWFADQDPVLHAEHLDRAEDENAPRAYLEAARWQASAYHYLRAIQMVERGLELAGPTIDRFALTCFRGELLHDHGEVAASMESYQRGLQLAENDIQRVPVWIGLASGMRIEDRYDEALETLDQAEAAAATNGLTSELARIHHLRGNLYFPLGRIEDCKEQHQLALGFAQDAHSLENEARALGGLGDAYYAQGRMRTGYEHFHRCVDLCVENGFGKIEVANRPMAAWTHLYFDPMHVVVDAAVQAIEAATRVAHERAEVIAQNCLAAALTDMGELDRAKKHCARQDALIRHLGARRFEVTSLTYHARIARMEDRQVEALGFLREAMKISRETGIGFFGARVLGTLAVATDDTRERTQALEEGEQILRSGAVSHNHFWFYRDAMEAALGIGEWDSVERYAASLEAFTEPEPLPWSDFFIAQGRALAAFGRGKRDEGTMSDLRRLRDEAKKLDLKTAMPALEEALAEA